MAVDRPEARRRASAHSSQMVTPCSCSERDVGVAAQEPEQLVDDRAGVWSFLVVSSGKPCGEVEAHLVAEDAQRAGAGAVALLDAVLQDVPEEVQILPHGGAGL